jgi:alanine racemase
MPGPSMAEIEQRGHPVWAEIDLGAIRHNIAVLKGLAERAQVMGVVKGYGYGHGNPASALAMIDAGATRLGVARVAEAMHLRQAGVAVPIHVFTEPPPPCVRTMIENDLTPTVYTQPFAEDLARAAGEAGVEVPIHVKLDTGMHRVGLRAEDVADAIRALKMLPNLRIEGAWTHLAVADVPDHPFTRKQLDLFEELLRQIESAGVSVSLRHAANSAATLSLPDSHYDLVRCGVATYGLWPGDDLIGAADLRPAMALRARANMVKTVAAGDRLSYGLHYELPETSRVVTVPAGYADGYDRRLSGRADVLIRGVRYRVSGTVCMDQFLVDVSDTPVEVGETITLLGRDGDEVVTAEELARTVDTINYEITTRVPSRVPRVYIDEASA